VPHNPSRPFYSEYAWAFDLLIDRPVQQECRTIAAWLAERLTASWPRLNGHEAGDCEFEAPRQVPNRESCDRICWLGTTDTSCGVFGTVGLGRVVVYAACMPRDLQDPALRRRRFVLDMEPE
jgi:hypothetical protein